MRSRRSGFVISVFPAIALVSTLISAGRSSRARPVSPPTGTPLASIEVGEQRTIAPSGLSVRVERLGVVVAVPDGGGTGEIPLRGSPVRRTVVNATDSGYSIDIATGSSSWEHVLIDREGVRIDDHLSARFADRVPPWLLALMIGVLAMSPLALVVRHGWWSDVFLIASAACAILPWVT